MRLQIEISTAFALNQHYISVFFNLEKAYDMTWRYGLLKDLHAWGLLGRLPQYIAEFLRRRALKVRIANSTSETNVQINGVPKGSVLSVTLFALKINTMAKIIRSSQNTLASLYVDDLQIAFRHENLSVIQTTMQQCISRIPAWAEENGCTFSTSQTKAIQFTNKPGIHFPPAFKLYKKDVVYVDSCKFLELVYDSKLMWQKHIGKMRWD